jgi:hypothetical protein
MPQRKRGQQGLDLALVADDREVLGVDGILREHAELEHGARTARVLDDHVRAVEDVGLMPIVVLVDVVDTLGPRCEHAQRMLAQDQGPSG